MRRLLLLLSLFLFHAQPARAQFFANQCPGGLAPIPLTRTTNQLTGALNDVMCYDLNGNLIFPALNASLQASDTFTRANGSLGPNWNNSSGTWSIVTNSAKGSATSNFAFWADPSFISTSQFSQATISTIHTSDTIGPAVFVSKTGDTLYGCSEHTTTIFLTRRIAGANTTLSQASLTGIAGDVLRLEIDSSGNLTCYKNGVSVLTANSTTLKSGSPGIVSGGSNGQITNWSGGNLPISPGSAPAFNGVTPQINKTCYVDGFTNTTIPQALTCAGSGGSVYIPKSYVATISSQINVTSPVSIIIDGASINFNAVLGFSLQVSNISVLCKNNATITLNGTNPTAFGIGDGLGGLANNITIEGCIINGSATVGLGQSAISAATASITNLAIRNNTITNVNVGISLVEAVAGGLLNAPKITGNYLKNIYGSAVGTGYGIVMGTYTVNTGVQTMQYMGAMVTNNYIENAGRHSVYVASGIGSIITDNYIKNNACISTPDGSLAVMPLSRKRAATVTGNIIDGSCDIGMQITGDNTFTGDSLVASSMTVSSNTFINNQKTDILIGNSVPSTNGTPDHITITGNTIYKTGFNVAAITLNSGQQISIVGNSITELSGGGNTAAFLIQGSGESGASHTYSDDIEIRNNLVHLTGAGNSWLLFANTAAVSAIRMDIIGNRVNASPMFCSGGPCTDPNITMADNPAVYGGNGFTRGALLAYNIPSNITADANVQANTFSSLTNCAVNSVSPAACGSAISGVFAVPTTTTTYTVNTTAVTANSRIFLQDITDNTGIPSAPTCVAIAAFGDGQVTSRVAATSFTISLPSTAGTTCFNYWIIN